MRRQTCAGLGFLNVQLEDSDAGHDDLADARPGAPPLDDRVLSRPGASPAVLVVHAREDLEIARQVRALLGHAG